MSSINYSELEYFNNSNNPIFPNNAQPSLSSIIKNDSNPQIKELVSIKETLLDIINDNQEITITDDSYENTEIKDVIQKIQGLTPNFFKLQDELYYIDKQYTSELKEIQKNLQFY